MSKKKKSNSKATAIWPKAGKKLQPLPGSESEISEQPNIRWNVPDWTDEQAYPNFKKATPQEWAWEFWRRSDDARQGAFTKTGWNPKNRKMPKSWRWSADYRPAIYMGPNNVKVDYQMAAIVVAIDRPLEEQLELAIRQFNKTKSFKRILKINTQYPIRHIEFATYLRVLDARSAGASSADVKREMGLDAKKARRYLRSALIWATRNWIYLLVRRPGRTSRNRKTVN